MTNMISYQGLVRTFPSKLADEYRARLTEQENVSLPLIAFYPVERVVLDIPLKIKEKHSFRQLDGYDNSLSQGVDFRRFFEWFREREDSENESVIPTEVLNELQDLLGPDLCAYSGEVEQPFRPT
ncbi:hypothetical protein ACET57_20090 [Aeromonas veronii]